MLTKSKTQYQIHALISRCHLHTKKKCSYSITLRMGSKAIASTQFRIPINDEISFNTQLILKIEKSLFQGPGKLSLIVTMLTQQKQKKIIGSVFTNFRQKGLQSYKVSQCSCKDKGVQVNVEFEVVNIQNLNNNQNNNKIQSTNQQEMKDLKKTLTISRQKQLVKSSRVKHNTGIKSTVQKTQSKLHKQRIEKQLKDQLSPDLSSLTTKIVPSSIKLNQQTKQYVEQLRIQITQLESKLKESSNKQRSHKKQISFFQNQMQVLKNQNQYLIEILKFQQEKSSAAMHYILYLTEKIGEKQLINSNINDYLKFIQNINDCQKTDTSQAIKEHKKSIRLNLQYKQIQQKQEINEQMAQKMMSQMEGYKNSIEQLRQRIFEMESEEIEKTQNINYLEIEVNKIRKENEYLKEKMDKRQKTQSKYEVQKNELTILNKSLQHKLKEFQKCIKQLQVSNQKIKNQKIDLQKIFDKYLQQNKNLHQRVIKLQNQISSLRQIQFKYQSLLKQSKSKQIEIQKLKTQFKKQVPKTPLESQISPHKSRFQEEQSKDIENIIEQLNGLNDDKNDGLLIVSRKVDQEEHFLSRNKSESLLKDLQINPDEEDPNTNESSKEVFKANYNNDQKKQKGNSLPQHVNKAQKYNYQYDIDSLNYFNNFEADHDRISEIGTDDNPYEVGLGN